MIRLTPDGVKPQQVIGVVVERMSLSEGTIVTTGRDTLYLHAILESALKHHYVTQALSLPSDYDWDSVNKRSGPFNHNVQGIISLKEFPTAFPLLEEEDRIPVVFITEQKRIGLRSNWEAQPMVTGDFYSGFYELTKRVLSFGHQDIAFFADTTRHPFYLEVCWWGFERALREAGLTPNREAFDTSLTMEPFELTSAKEFLELYGSATAIICENIRTAQNIIAIADMQGISVPQDLSIVAQGYGPMRPGKEKKMTCLQYDIPRAVEICFDLLMEQLKTRTCSIRQARVCPIIFDGESLAPPTS